MALARNARLNLMGTRDDQILSFPVKAAVHIFTGAMVGLDAATGLARPLVAGDAFAGIAMHEADNSAGANGAKTITLSGSCLAEMPLAGVAQTDAGVALYASDDGALTKTSTANSLVGRIIRPSGVSGIAHVRLITAL